MDETFGSYGRWLLSLFLVALAIGDYLRPVLFHLLVGLLVGVACLTLYFVLDVWSERRSASRSRDDAPLRVRVKEWGDAIEVWSKIALRVSGIVLVLFCGAGSAGTLARMIPGL